MPDGFNIFKLLNLSAPNETGIDGWRITMKNDSIRHEKVVNIFTVSQNLGQEDWIACARVPFDISNIDGPVRSFARLFVHTN